MLAGDVWAILGARVDPSGFAAYDAALAKATGSAAKAEAAQVKTNTAMTAGAASAGKFGAVAKTAAAGGAIALAAGLAKSVSEAASFDKQMDRIGAVTQANARDMKAMADIAKDLGQKTGIGATEAARGMEALAKGGLTTEQIISGGLAGALQLAQAGTMEVGAAAEATANALNLFGLGGDKATHVADALSVAAADTTADVSDFALALSQGGSAAKLAGLSFDETVVALEALAKIGVKGSDAGTSLKAAMLQVIDPSDEAAKTMKKLGIDFTDAQGKMKPLADVADLLRDKIGKLSKEEQVAALKRMAGTDGFRALAALMEQGGSGVDKLAGGLKKQGDAARVAKENTDNLGGAWDRLKASIQNLAIEAGGPFLEPLQEGMDSLAKSLDDLRAGKGSISAVVDDINSIGNAVRDVLDFANVGTAVGDIFGGIGQAVGGVVKTLKSVVSGDIGGVFDGLKDVVVGSLRAITAPVRGLASGMVGPFKAAGSAILGVFSSIIGAVAKVAEGMSKIPGIGRVWKAAAEGARDAEDAINGLRDSLNGVKQPKPIKIDTAALRKALRDIDGTDIEPKVLKILGNDKDAKGKTKALIALGIPPKTAKLLADAANLLAGARGAQQAIDRVPSSKTVTVSIGGSWAGALATIQGTINALHGKTVEIGTRKRAKGRGPGGSEVALVGEGRHAREAVVDPRTGFAGVVEGPTLLGLSSSAYVIPEDPMQRGRSMGLLAMLAKDLGLRGFAKGKKGAGSALGKAGGDLGRPVPAGLSPTLLPLDQIDKREQAARTALQTATGKVKELPEKIKADEKRIKDIGGRAAKTAATKAKKARDLAKARDDLAENRRKLASAKAAEVKRRAEWNELRKQLAQAKRWQAEITKLETQANTEATRMGNANKRGDLGGYNSAKKARTGILTRLKSLLFAAKGAYTGQAQLDAEGAFEDVVGQLIEVQQDPEAATDDALSEAEKIRLGELDRGAAEAALTDPTGDDLDWAKQRDTFLSGLLGAAQSGGRSNAVVTELAGMVKQARDDIKSLSGGDDRSPDLNAQLEQANRRATLAEDNAKLNQQFLATALTGGDIGTGGFQSAPSITIQTLHPGDPKTLAAIGAAAVGGMSLQGGRTSPRTSVA